MAKLKVEDPQFVAAAIYTAYQKNAEDWRRDHLGASLIGHDCDRYLWLSFRWAQHPGHSGRMLRLFERGKREESWVIEDLKRIGCEVNGTQDRVKRGHIGGSLDGIVKGVPGAALTPHVLEIKTHNRKSFDRLTQDGVKRAQPKHYAQMQVYMRLKEPCIERALYVAVCKDDDNIYTERVELDRKAADQILGRAEAIARMDQPPARFSKDQPPCLLTSADGTTWPCNYYSLCHGTAFPEKSCRMCISADPLLDGTWDCLHHQSVLDENVQRAACSAYLTIPNSVNAQVVDVAQGAARRVTYQFADGTVRVDGFSV